MKCVVIDEKGEETSPLELSKDFFPAEIKKEIIQLVVRWQQAKRQSGCHSSKTVSEVQGSTKKPYSQKRTGRARMGSLYSAQRRGGGIAMGPVVRSHAFKLNKKVRNLALRMTLAAKFASGKLVVIESLNLDKPKTKLGIELLKKINLGLNCLVVFDGDDVNLNFQNSIASVYGVDILPCNGINVESILSRDKLVLTKNALLKLEGRLL